MSEDAVIELTPVGTTELLRGSFVGVAIAIAIEIGLSSIKTDRDGDPD